MVSLLLITCVVTLGMSFLCSITEAVLLSLNPLALKLQHSRGGKSAGNWLGMKQRIERPVSAILIFNTVANTGLAMVAAALFVKIYGDDWLWLFSLVLTVAILLGVHYADRLAPWLIHPLSFMLRVSHPFVVLVEKFCQRLKRNPADDRSASERIMDIITLVQTAKAEQLLHNREEIIIIHAATLSARRVKTAMVPRDSVNFFDRRKTLRENIQAAGPKVHRSYPVMDDGKIAGYVRVRELFVQNLLEPDATDWTKLIRPALRMDANASLTHLLATFLERGEIAALVNDPKGQLQGWITLDDVTQVLMGARI